MNWMDVPQLLLAAVFLRALYRLESRWRNPHEQVFIYPLSAMMTLAVLLVSAALTIGFGLYAIMLLDAPWVLNQTPPIRGAHQWSLGVASAAGAVFFHSGAAIAVALLFDRNHSRVSVYPKCTEPQAVSPELRARFAELTSDRLWNEGYPAVAAHLHRTALCAMTSEEEEEPWESDEPLWDALRAELERRFTCAATRAEAERAIAAEYVRVAELD